MNRPAVALFMPHLGYGGVERVNLNLAQGFVADGRATDLVVVRAEGELAEAVAPDVGLVDLGADRMLQAIPRLASYLRRRRPGALLSSKTHANVAAGIAHRMAGARMPHIVCEHSRFQLEDPSGLADEAIVRLAGRLYSRAHRIVAVSGDVAAAWSGRTGIPPDRFTIIPNPVVTPDLEERSRRAIDDPWLRSGPPVLVTAGRLVKEKDFATLLRAVARVRERRPVRLLILGEGEERPRLEAVLRELDLADAVRLPGFVPNPLPYFRAARLFVLSSTSEAFPVVLVEALFCGCPVVATRCSVAVDEVLEGGRLGRLVSPADPDALADAIIEALASPTAPERSRRRAEDFSVERIVRRYRALLPD